MGTPFCTYERTQGWGWTESLSDREGRCSFASNPSESVAQYGALPGRRGKWHHRSWGFFAGTPFPDYSTSISDEFSKWRFEQTWVFPWVFSCCLLGLGPKLSFKSILLFLFCTWALTQRCYSLMNCATPKHLKNHQPGASLKFSSHFSSWKQTNKKTKNRAHVAQHLHFWVYMENKAIIQRDTCTPMFITALFTVGRIWKQPSTVEWIKMRYLHTMEHYSAIKKNEIMPFSETWMDLETIIQCEVSQKEKNKYHVVLLICRI